MAISQTWNQKFYFNAFSNNTDHTKEMETTISKIWSLKYLQSQSLSHCKGELLVGIIILDSILCNKGTEDRQKDMLENDIPKITIVIINKQESKQQTYSS